MLKRLSFYLRGRWGETVLAPLFKLIEACLELTVPLIMGQIINRGIATGDQGFVVRACLLLVLIGWVFFFSPSLGSAFLWLARMLGIGTTGFVDATAKYYLGSSVSVLLIGAVSAFPVGANFGNRLLKGKSRRPIYLSVLWFGVLLLLCIAGMMSSTYSSFLYFQF